MPRLDPAEAARRKKERARQRWADMKSGAAYKKYDPNDGFGRGSEQQWRSTAESIHGGEIIQILKTDADLELLGLTEMPDQAGLDRAYRRAARTAHPDAGGSDAQFIAVKDAYDRLSEKLPRR
jgi:hypothetical protein